MSSEFKDFGMKHCYASNWRNVLEHMLKSLEGSDSGGIKKCIIDALAHGPNGLTKELKAPDVLRDTAQKDVQSCDTGVKDEHQHRNAPKTVTQYVRRNRVPRLTGTNINTVKCQKLFFDILCSEKFALACELFSENFHDKKTDFFFDFSLIHSKMKNGDYEHSPALFDEDICQVWSKFQKLGERLVLLASSLSSMSAMKQETCVAVEKNCVESDTSAHFTCASERSAGQDQIEASVLYKSGICKQCGTEATSECSLICDGCEAIFHFFCVKPAIKEIPSSSWYCSSCTPCMRNLSEPTIDHVKHGRLHHNCTVCDMLELPGAQLDLDENGTSQTQQSSVSSMNDSEKPELSTVNACLCKVCGTCEDEDKKFLICDHDLCPYKFYHVRCLRSSQIASAAQQNRQCWYCPSCLCRACFCDKDDEQIVLCDGCDEAYHLYCMTPPRVSVPKDQWYCLRCTAARAKEGMKRYEQWIMELHRKNHISQSEKAHMPMDLPSGAAETRKPEKLFIRNSKRQLHG